MNYKLLTLLLFLLPFTDSVSLAQENSPSNHTEKIDIHMAGSDFIAGEEVWMQIYCLNKNADSFSDLSDFAYVEIISPWGYSVARKKVLLKEGVGSNVLELPDTLTGGVYRLIAYTNWMKNFDYNNFFSEDIRVYNPEKRNGFKAEKVDKNNTALDFQYTLDQNELVDELSATVYIRTEEFSKTDSVQLAIIEKNTASILDSLYIQEKYNELHFIPEKGKMYAVKMSGNGRQVIKDLPEVRENGINFTITNITKNSVNVLFQGNPSQNTQINRYVVKKEGGEEVLASFPVFGRQQVNIPAEQLSNGYSKLYLEDDKGNTVNTKTVFLPVHKHSIRVENLKSEFDTKTKVDLEFELPQKIRNNRSVISISVRRTHDKNSGKKNENVGFKTKNNALRFSTKKYHNPNPEKYFAPERKRAFLNGSVNYFDTSEVENKSITLSFVDSVTRIKKTYTDEENRFKFRIHPIKPDVDLVLNSPENSEKIQNLEITNNFIDDFEFFVPDQFHSHKTDKDFIKELYLTQRIYETYELTNIKPEESKNNIHVRKWISNSFYGIPDEIVKFDEYVLLNSLREYFRELITWARISRSNKQYDLTVIDKETGSPFSGDPAIFLDGVLYNDIDSLMDIEPHLCKKVEIIRSPVLILDKLYYGLFALYTKQANLDDIELPKSATRVAFPLYNRNVDFYVPDKQASYPDFRNTLYWKSTLGWDNENESIPIRFDTPKNEGFYELKIKGYTENGDLIEQKAYFEVKKP